MSQITGNRIVCSTTSYDDVIAWERFPVNWSSARGIHRPPAGSHTKGQWRGALVFSLMWDWTNSWTIGGVTCDFRYHEVMWWRCNVQLKTKRSTLLALCAWLYSPRIKWKRFPRAWPFVKGIHRSSVDSPHKGRSCDAFFDVCLNKRLNKQSRRQWFETPWHPLWRHSNDLRHSGRGERPYWRDQLEPAHPRCCPGQRLSRGRSPHKSGFWGNLMRTKHEHWLSITSGRYIGIRPMTFRYIAANFPCITRKTQRITCPWSVFYHRICPVIWNTVLYWSAEYGGM